MKILGVPVSSMESRRGIEIETVMRIRPLLKKEKDDFIVLEAQDETTNSNHSSQTVVLNPMNQSLPTVNGRSNRTRIDSDSTATNLPKEYHFDHVLPENTNQEKIFYTVGLPIVTATMNSLKNVTSRQSRDMSTKNHSNHLLISMGIENSGKTFTCFGGKLTNRRASQDGLVPRLLDSMFSQSNHASGGSRGFAVQISILQVSQQKGKGSNSDPSSCRIYDVLGDPPQSSSSSSKGKIFGASPIKKKKNLNVRSMAARFERAIPIPSPRNRRTQKISDGSMMELDAENIKPKFHDCLDITEAREILQSGFNRSQKYRTIDENYHLYISMQPVIGGTKFGDSISILDMAGVETENRKQSIREELSVTGTNQAAYQAVFNCLKTISQNMNNTDSTPRFVSNTHSDDEVSELSVVSNPKYHAEDDHLKNVPFRRHKITMILNKLFLQNATVRVTLLLSAYPGHIDYPQKRILLQDIEILHGHTLAMPSNTCSEEAGSPNRMREENDKKNEFQPNRSNQKRTGKVVNSFEQGERSKYRPRSSENRLHFQANEQKIKTKPHRGAQRIPKVEPIEGNSRSVHSSAKPSAPPMITQNYDHRVEPFGSPEPKIKPSAPVCEDSMKVNEDFVADFPGAQIPTSTEKGSEFFTLESGSFPKPSTIRRNTQEEQLIITGEEENNSMDFFQQEQSVSFHKNVDTKKNDLTNSKKRLKSPLRRSRLENSEDLTTSNAGQAQNTLPRKEDKRLPFYTNQDSSPLFDNNFASEVKDIDNSTVEKKLDQNKSDNHIKALEEKLRQSQDETKALKKICSQLESENAELTIIAREAGRKARQIRWTEQDEKDFLESRRMRHEAQNIIKEPITNHLEKVNYIYGIKNQWCMSNKQHFSLTFPNHFQRAPALDFRDSKMVEVEPVNIGNVDINPKKIEAMNISTSNDESKGHKSPFRSRKSLTIRVSPMKSRLTPMKSVEAPARLSALKKLVGKRN